MLWKDGGFHPGAHYDSELDTLSVLAPGPLPGPLDGVLRALADLPADKAFRVKGVRGCHCSAPASMSVPFASPRTAHSRPRAQHIRVPAHSTLS